MHSGLVPDVECFNDCEEGWNVHIMSCLVKFNNKARGMPE